MLPPVNSAHRRTLAPIATPDRLLLGPGPSNAHPTVLQALARMPIGHLDPLILIEYASDSACQTFISAV